MVQGAEDEHVFSVTARDFEARVLQERVPVMVDFHARWCGPCRMLTPMLEGIARLSQGKLKLAKVDVDKEGDVAAVYGISRLPTVLGFRRGRVVSSLIGAQKEEAVRDFADRLMSSSI